tara:strand:- start:2167 stop:3435 length:1269 start_codon:yes stop_codon:yes gene_type:complete
MKTKEKRQTDVIRSSLKTSTIEGSWWAVMYGMVETYFGAFFEILKYTSFEISILTTFPIFIGAFAQNLVNKIFHYLQSRKTLLVILKLLQSLLIPSIYLIGLWFNNFFVFLFFICIYFIIALSQMSPWTSWMGYLVPGRIRGRYFGNRSQIIRIATLISSLFAGAILHAFENTDPIIGFGFIFFIGVIANLGSAYYLYSQYEPEYHAIIEEGSNVNLNDYKYKQIKHFITYDSISEFSYSISGPLMIVYWIRELKFNYFEIALLINVSQILGLLSMRYWGRKVDKIGPFSIVRVCSLFISVFPILWIIIFYISPQLKLPASIVLASLASLFFNGRALAMDNRMYDHMNGRSMIQLTSKRIFYRGILIFIGALFGGFISKTNFFLDMAFLETLTVKLHFVFLVSSITRIVIWIIFLRKKLGSI